MSDKANSIEHDQIPINNYPMEYSETKIPPFYFIIVFWGSEHRGYFLDLLLASLLAPSNIPVLENQADNRFIICTTDEDWQAIQHEEIFKLMKTYIQPIHIKMEFPKPEDLKMLVMSKGHKAASTMAFNDKAIGVFVTPDLVLSDGSVAAMQRLAKEGYYVVLCPAMRFEHYGCIEGFKQLNAFHPGLPLVLTGRQLMSVALKNLHSETIRYLWDTNHFAEQPITCLWKVEDEDSYVVHTFSWAPLVLNYAALKEHDTKTFEKWTLDGDYVYANFGGENIESDDSIVAGLKNNKRKIKKNERIYVVKDTDEIALVSFTKEEDLHIPAVPSKLQSVPFFGSLFKMGYIYMLYHNLTIMDPLKKRLFLKTCYFHSLGINNKVQKTAIRAQIVIRRAIAIYYFSVVKILMDAWVHIKNVFSIRIWFKIIKYGLLYGLLGIHHRLLNTSYIYGHYVYPIAKFFLACWGYFWAFCYYLKKGEFALISEKIRKFINRLLGKTDFNAFPDEVIKS